MITANEMQERTAKLRRVITDMSEETLDKDKDGWSDVIGKLGKIYTIGQDGKSEYRHEYSQFFGLLTELRTGSPDAFENLRQNLTALHDACGPDFLTALGADPQTAEPFAACLYKLYDHLNLEMSRIDYTDSIQQKIDMRKAEVVDLNQEMDALSGHMADIHRQQEELKKKLEKALEDQNNLQSKLTEELEETGKEQQKKIEGAQKENITILGLFSAVVLSFMSGIGFSSSVLESMQHSSIYKAAFLCLALGLVLTNLLFLLFRFILHIHKPGEEYPHLKRWVKWANGILLALILLVVAAWAIDLKTIVEHFQAFLFGQ
mgnify:CR=1 FL=1